MRNQSAASDETEMNDTTAAAAKLHAEIDEVRRRLAALEARGHANQIGGRKRRWRVNSKMISLITAAVMVAGATIVFGQSAVDSLFVSKEGNVGVGTTTPQAKLDVGGNMRVAGTLSSQGRYQTDDSAETTYELSPRYHLSLTGTMYARRTRQIPQQVINDLCGDQDGCEFRLGMTRWRSNELTETASKTALFYYSTADGRWRVSSGVGVDPKGDPKVVDPKGVDGKDGTQHVSNAWDTCYFTDARYSDGRDLGDAEIGMHLLVWTGNGNPSRTCELTLID